MSAAPASVEVPRRVLAWWGTAVGIDPITIPYGDTTITIGPEWWVALALTVCLFISGWVWDHKKRWIDLYWERKRAGFYDEGAPGIRRRLAQRMAAPWVLLAAATLVGVVNHTLWPMFGPLILWPPIAAARAWWRVRATRIPQV